MKKMMKFAIYMLLPVIGAIAFMVACRAIGLGAEDSSVAGLVVFMVLGTASVISAIDDESL